MSVEAGTGDRGDRKSHSLLLRKGSSNKIALKEKIVQIYEAFFQVHIGRHHYFIGIKHGFRL